MKKKPTNVREYIAAAPKASQAKLRQMRTTIRSAAPKAKESLKWGMPAFSARRMLVAYAGYAHHVGFYPTPSAVKAFKDKIAGYKSAKGSIQFPIEKPLPLALVRDITKFRVKESEEKDAKWRE